jgi:hypothetical protein
MKVGVQTNALTALLQGENSPGLHLSEKKKCLTAAGIKTPIGAALILVNIPTRLV